MDAAMQARIKEMSSKLNGAADTLDLVFALVEYKDVMRYAQRALSEASTAPAEPTQHSLPDTHRPLTQKNIAPRSIGSSQNRRKNLAAMDARLADLESKLEDVEGLDALSLLQENEDVVAWWQWKNCPRAPKALAAEDTGPARPEPRVPANRRFAQPSQGKENVTKNPFENKKMTFALYVRYHEYQYWKSSVKRDELTEEYNDVITWLDHNFRELIMPAGDTRDLLTYLADMIKKLTAADNASQPLPTEDDNQSLSPEEDARIPLPRALQALLKRKNAAMKAYDREPSPDNRKLLRKLQRETKRKVAAFRASLEQN